MQIVSIPISMHDSEVENKTEMVEIVAHNNAPVSKEREDTTNAFSGKSGDWVTTRTQLGHKVGMKSGVFDPTTGNTVKWAK